MNQPQDTTPKTSPTNSPNHRTLEELIYEKYTVADDFFLALRVGPQTMRIENSWGTEKRIEFYRRTLATALARLVTEVAREVNGTEADIGG